MAKVRFPNESYYVEVKNFDESKFTEHKNFDGVLFGEYLGVYVFVKL